MVKITRLFLTLFLGIALVAPVLANAATLPRLEGRVNDYAGMLSPQTRQELDGTLAALEASDSTQIVVLTINSLDGESVEEYALQVAQGWGIGQKDSDNGALLLVAKNDRKIRIEVGYGLEGRLTDLLSGRIIDSLITPQFKKGDFNAGIRAGVDAMVKAVKGEFTAKDLPAKRKSSPKGNSAGDFIFLFIFSSLFLNKLGKANRVLAAVIGAVALPIIAILAFAPGALILLILVVVGAIYGFFIGPLYTLPAGHSSGRSSWSSGGSSFGGGGFSGGGGGFGGGGASGGW